MRKLSRSIATRPLRALALLSFGSMMLLPVEAMAFFDAQVGVGRRWYDFEQDGTSNGAKAQEINVAVHIDPIPLVPVAFGASVGMLELDKDDLGSGTTKAAVVEPAFEVMAWLPMVPVVTPYARLKVPVMARLAMTHKTTPTGGTAEVEAAQVYKLSGYHLNAGIKWGPLPLVKFLAEVGIGKGTAKPDEIKIDGTKVSTAGTKEITANSKSFLLGIEVGI